MRTCQGLIVNVYHLRREFAYIKLDDTCKNYLKSYCYISMHSMCMDDIKTIRKETVHMKYVAPEAKKVEMPAALFREVTRN